MEIEANTWETALRALERAVAFYLEDPNVTLIDLGYRRSAASNQAAADLAVRVHVRQKLTGSAFSAFAVEEPDRVISAERLGFPVEVLPAIYRLQLSSRNFPVQSEHVRVYDRLCGGLSISGEWRQNFGTLGGKVRDRQTGEELLLSAWHVLSGATNKNFPGAIYQPAREHDGTARPGIAEYRRSALANHLDAAVAQLTNQRPLLNSQLGLGSVTGVASPQLGVRVAKSGCGTGVTHGVITGVHGYSLQRYAGISHLISHIVQITPENAEEKICGYGDSGAWWLECATQRAVAMHFAGCQQPHLAIGLAMPEVLAALDVDIVTTSDGESPITITPPQPEETLPAPQPPVTAAAESFIESKELLPSPQSAPAPSKEISEEPFDCLSSSEANVEKTVPELSTTVIAAAPALVVVPPSTFLPVAVSPRQNGLAIKNKLFATITNWHTGFKNFQAQAVQLLWRIKTAIVSQVKKLTLLASRQPTVKVIETIEFEVIDEEAVSRLPRRTMVKRGRLAIASLPTYSRQRFFSLVFHGLSAIVLIPGGFMVAFNVFERHLQEYQQTRETQLYTLRQHLQQAQSLAEFAAHREQQINKITLIINRFRPELAGFVKYDLACEIVTLSQKYKQLNSDLICAVITVETRWNPEAVSFAGAMGLMQMMPATAIPVAKAGGIIWTSPEDILFDPLHSTRLGCQHLAFLVEKYGLEAGLAGYNAGEKWAQKWQRLGHAPPGLPDETSAYVPSIMKLYKLFQSLKP